MIRPGMVWAIARSEARLTRRLARYWIFGAVTTLFCLLAYAQWAFIHTLWSAVSATAASMNPRFVLGFLGFWAVSVFSIGVTFLAFEIRARDVRERIFEVMDSRPFTNLELILGRYLGILIPTWFQMTVTVLTIWVIALLIGSSISPVSIVQFLVFETIPAFTLFIGVAFLVSLLARHRGVSAVLLILVVFGLVFANFIAPVWLSPLADISGAFNVPFPSDLVTEAIESESLMQRLGMLLAGFGLLVLAAAAHPRLDSTPRKFNLAAGLAILLVGVLVEVAIVGGRVRLIDRLETWQAAHAARQDEPAPDLRHVSATVDIDPGRRLVLDVEMKLAAPVDGFDTALFTLNPGLEVERVVGPGGSELSVTQEHGLVDVRLPAPLSAGEPTALRWSIAGKPDRTFGYLDTAQDLMNLTTLDGNVFWLGYENLLFRKSHVALPPGARWLPAPGSDVGRGDHGVRVEDFFTLELTVTLPDGWLVAGPGKRQETPDGFRFSSGAPVAGAALIADEYVSRSAEIEGITAEVLVSPKHAATLELFEDAGEEIREAIAERLREAADVGLGYPYDGITLVEVPNLLRGYGGGWRMDTILGQPGIMMMREVSFPTARFDRRFKDPSRFEEQEGGVERAKRETVETFFGTDFNGGNLFTGVSRSFFVHQTRGAGPGGLPLDYVSEDLASRVVTDSSGYFSAYVFDRDLGNRIQTAVNKFVTDQQAGRGSGTVADAFIELMTGSVDVWESTLGVALVDLDPWENPGRAINVLALKGGAMARSLLDGLGREKTGRLLSELRERSWGGEYTQEDLLAAGQAVGEDLSSWLDVWLEQTDLPGYIVDDVKAYRAEDAADGTPRYALSFVLRNDEPVPGLIRVLYTVGEDDDRTEERTDPIAVPAETALEVGLVLSAPPRWVSIDPYLSLNRKEFDIAVPPIDEERIEDDEPFEGQRVVAWEPDTDAVIVDDLSEGFSIEVDERRSLRLGAKKSETLDQGLPERQPAIRPKTWSREEIGQAYGKYRHTTALVRGGKGDQRAVFEAELPARSLWNLEIHLPRAVRASWSLRVQHDAGVDEPLEFDADGAGVGWNSLGSFDLDRGAVRVVLSDETDGMMVYADAIRWVPSRGSTR